MEIFQKHGTNKMKTTENIINVNQRNTFLVKFRYQMAEQYIVQNSGLIEVLKNCDKNGIEFIKVFNPAKNNFIRISREQILQNYNWETENYLYLQNHYFFKKQIL